MRIEKQAQSMLFVSLYKQVKLQFINIHYNICYNIRAYIMTFRSSYTQVTDK